MSILIRRTDTRSFTCRSIDSRITALMLIAAVVTCGCVPPLRYFHNDCKVGPNYCPPPAAVAINWIDANDVRVRNSSDDLSRWWAVFNDPVLDSLICQAYGQNLTLRQAGFRVLQARAQKNIAVGGLFPQTQQAFGDYTRNAQSKEVANTSSTNNQFFDQWDVGFNLAWELDFWGRFRRAVEAANANLDASVEDYDDVLVTLLGDVATNYVQLRTFQQRIAYAQENVRLQRETLTIVEARFKAGTTTELDVVQARSTLQQTEAQIPELLITLRTTSNALCTLLGIPPEELTMKLGTGLIPTAPTKVAVGIPADLVRRRPDVRRAERLAAAQSAQIGIAAAEFYPHISILGTIGYSAEQLKDLFKPSALQGSVGPSFQWNILNYGRLVNNVRLQDARFQELVVAYQSTALTAAQEAEDGLVTFLRAQQRTQSQAGSVADGQQAVAIALKQYQAGTIDFTRITQLEQNLVPLQDTLAIARGEIALGLIQIYRALGGGWDFRGCCEPVRSLPSLPDKYPAGVEMLPSPRFPPPPLVEPSATRSP